MNNSFYRILLVTSILTFYGNAYSQKWIPLSGNPKGEALTMEVLEDNATTYRVSITLNGLYDTEVINDHGTFHDLSIGTMGKLMEKGEPSLPLISQLIAIPPGATVSVALESEKWVELEIGTILPAQEFGDSCVFYIDGNAYRQPYLPPLLTMGEEGCWRGIRNVAVNLCPIKYYPTEGKLAVLKESIICVNFINENHQETHDLFLEEGPECQGLFCNNVYTESFVTENNRSAYSDNYDYLIIAANSTLKNSDKMIELKRWKALKGLKTAVVVITGVGASQAEIKQYIAAERQKGVKYVLFVGDETTIPMANINSYTSKYGLIDGDYWYGCLSQNDDWQASVPIGRFSTNSLWEFGNMVNKTIRYERTRPMSDDYLLVAHKLYPNDVYGYQKCSEDIYYNHNGQASFVTAYGASFEKDGNEATNAMVDSLINTGVPLVNYRGFGQANYWGGDDVNSSSEGWNTAGENFYNTECNNFGNTACTVFFSISANTGNIAESNNMLESFTRATHGAVAFLGSTTQNYPRSNHYLDQFLYNMLLDSAVYRLGDINMKAQIKNISHYNNSIYYLAETKNNAFSYICGGDPSLELWTAHPQSIGNVDLTESGNSITLCMQASTTYTVCVATENGELVNRIDVNGNTCTFTKPEGNFYIAVNKHNYVPHVIYYNVDADAIQNTTFTNDAYYHHTPLAIGYGVTADELDGEVVVKEGSKLVIKNSSGGVTLDYGFKCEKGAVLEIK